MNKLNKLQNIQWSNNGVIRVPEGREETKTFDDTMAETFYT